MTSTRARTDPTSIGALLRTSAVGRVSVVDRGLWQQAVGERVAQRTEAGKLRDGTLEVRVASPVWGQELSLLAPAIAERLRAMGAPVRRLRFHVGSVEPSQDVCVRTTRAPERAELPPDLIARLERIEDATLRETIAEAAAYCLGRSHGEATSSRRVPRAPGSVAPRSARSDQTSFPGQRGAPRTGDKSRD